MSRSVTVASNTAQDLRGVNYGANAATGALVIAAVGVNGTLVTSGDGVTWTAQPALGTNTLYSISTVIHGNFQVSGTQFVIVGANGTIYTSTDGATWALQPSTTSNNLYAVTHSSYTYSYEAVGAAGTTLMAN